MSVYITPQDELHVEHEGIALTCPQWPHQPDLDGERAGVLLEVMRDLLYQTFVRKARLLQPMTNRRHVAPVRVETGT